MIKPFRLIRSRPLVVSLATVALLVAAGTLISRATKAGLEWESQKPPVYYQGSGLAFNDIEYVHNDTTNKYYGWIGGTSTGPNQPTPLLYYNGSYWENISGFPSDWTSFRLNDISQIYFNGQYRVWAVGYNHNIIYLPDGKSVCDFSSDPVGVPCPNAPAGATGYQSVKAVASEDGTKFMVFVAWNKQIYKSQVVTDPDEQLQFTLSKQFADEDGPVMSIDATDLGRIWVSTYKGRIFYNDDIQNSDSWSSTSGPWTDIDVIEEVSAVDDNHVWAVAYHFDMADFYSTIYFFNGSIWVEQYRTFSTRPIALHAIDGYYDSDRDIYMALAVGSDDENSKNGAVFQYNGNIWERQDGNTQSDLYGVSIASLTQARAVGEKSTIMVSSPGNIFGWVWLGSSTIDGSDDAPGWASGSCVNQLTCESAGFTYGVNVRTVGLNTGVMTGHLWAGNSDPNAYFVGDCDVGNGYCKSNHEVECTGDDTECRCALNIAACIPTGWISFNKRNIALPELPDPPGNIESGNPPEINLPDWNFHLPDTTHLARYDSKTGKVLGWARILSFKTSDADSGWIRLRGDPVDNAGSPLRDCRNCGKFCSLSMGRCASDEDCGGTIMFEPKVDYPVQDEPFSSVAGDFTEDVNEFPDLAVTNKGSDSISILTGNGNGTFTNTTTINNIGDQPFTIVTGDFDEDGHIDLAAGNIGGNGVSVLLGNGDGTFSEEALIPAGESPRAITTGKFNSDDHLDIAVANDTDDNVSILLGNGDGTFAPASVYATEDAPRSIVAGDFNNDGKLDLAVANFFVNKVTILLGNGDGTFASALYYSVASGGNPREIALGDFNSDGKPDLVTANWSLHNVSVLLGVGDGSFAEPALNYDIGGFASSVAVSDLNNDEIPDLAVAKYQDNKITTLLGIGNGSFEVYEDVATGAYPRDVLTGDFDANGKVDLIAANASSDDLSILMGIIGANGTCTVQICKTCNQRLDESSISCNSCTDQNDQPCTRRCEFDFNTSCSSNLQCGGSGVCLDEIFCDECDTCDQYGVSINDATGKITGFGWSGGSTAAGQVGWVDFSYANYFSQAWLQTKYGDIYANADIGSANTPNAPSASFNATYLITAAGTITNFSTSKHDDPANPDPALPTGGPFIKQEFGEIGFPDSASNYTNILGQLDVNGITTVVDFAQSKNKYGDTVVTTSEENATLDDIGLCDLSGDYLDGRVFHVKGNLNIEPCDANPDPKFMILNGTNDQKSGSGTIVVDGTLTINMNIEYEASAPLADITKLASLGVIVKKNMVVTGQVDDMVGSYVVFGDDPSPTGSNIAIDIKDSLADRAFSVKGLLIGKSFRFGRTYRGTVMNPEPAEKIQYDGRVVANPPPGFRSFSKTLPLIREIIPSS